MKAPPTQPRMIDDDDRVSLSSASAHVRRESLELKRQLEDFKLQVEAPPLPPPGAPPLPSAALPAVISPSPLRQALVDLAAQKQDGPMFLVDGPVAVAEPTLDTRDGPRFLGIGTPGRLHGLNTLSHFNGSTGVVATDKDGSGKFSFELLSGQILAGMSDHFVVWLKAGDICAGLLKLAEKVTATDFGGGDGGKGSGAEPQLALADSPTPVASDDFYAQLSQGAKSKATAEARKVREALDKWSARASFLGAWARAFWNEIAAIGVSSPQLKVVLGTHGYLGKTTVAPPRVDELRKQLKEFEQKGFCGAGAKTELLEDVESWALEEDLEKWGNALPDNMQRAAPEIYRNLIGGNGRSNLRDIIDEYFPLSSRAASPEYLELFNIATSIDFLAQRHKHSAAALMQALAGDDNAEIGLRRITSWLHEKRTGDKTAAKSMLAVQPRGQYANAAPQWLLDQSQAHSQAEHKTRERVESSYVPKQTHTPKGDDSKGKGKGKKKGRAKGGNPPAAAATQG